MYTVTLVDAPVIIPLAAMTFLDGALTAMQQWIATTHPDCYPPLFSLSTARDMLTRDPDDAPTDEDIAKYALFPHHGGEWGEPLSQEAICRQLTDNELLVELAGRLCYMSFGAKAGTPTNKRYIAHTQLGEIPHKSLMYHPKMAFFLSGISRRLSHELIRHYVGADRSEEGSPSMESTRYVEHPGHFVVHPYILASSLKVECFRESVQSAYNAYRAYIDEEMQLYGVNARGLARKRIYESASSYLPHSAMTSMVWTTNPEALKKLFIERTNESADLEFQRLALQWKALCTAQWPNLFIEKAV